ncbi:hypothetical protein [Frigoribacterium sp. Leaf172]|uniref:hypothetical protein n=1 Tax=Frigoribacterium sp. Leaf172 TaxID=1736285 RepID=UPI0012E70EE4|nr:hypothetical protein [Frigoribacterium sp. Leaf172]
MGAASESERTDDEDHAGAGDPGERDAVRTQNDTPDEEPETQDEESEREGSTVAGPGRLGWGHVASMGRGGDGVDGKASRISRSEDAVATIFGGVGLIGVGFFIAVNTPDLGETMARNGLPMWALVGLLGAAGIVCIAGGSVMLLTRRLRRARRESDGVNGSSEPPSGAGP